MITVGLTGSIGTGKSEALNYLADKGIPTFDADQAVHELYAQDDIVSWVQQNFPDAVQQGKVDRKILGQIVQQEPKHLKTLEEKLHPLVRQMSLDFIESKRAIRKVLIVLDIPLLFESGREEDFDSIMVTATSDALQKERVLARANMNQARLDEFLARQMPQEEKIERADVVVWNNGTVADFHRKIDEAIGKILAKHPQLIV